LDGNIPTDTLAVTIWHATQALELALVSFAVGCISGAT
jgi:hypothetical protein